MMLFLICFEIRMKRVTNGILLLPGKCDESQRAGQILIYRISCHCHLLKGERFRTSVYMEDNRIHPENLGIPQETTPVFIRTLQLASVVYTQASQ